MNTVGKAILIGIGALGALSAIAQLATNYTETTVEVTPSVDVFCTYSNCIKAIMSSNLYETTKYVLLGRIPAGACGDYYKSVIAVIESSKQGNNTFIVSQVEKITRAFGYEI